MVEYVVIISLLSVAAMVAINLLGGTINSSFTTAQDAIQAARGIDSGSGKDSGGKDQGGKDRD